MSDSADAPISSWALAEWAARIFAVDPAGTGVCLRARPGPQRERWLALLRSLMPDAPMRKVPISIADDRLLGGLDLSATLAAGRPVAERGVLADADGGAALVPSAERMSVALAARLAAVHDRGEIRLERDGLTDRRPARFGLVLFDEGADADEHPPEALMDRMAFRVDLSALGLNDISSDAAIGPKAVAAARGRFPHVRVADEIVEAICGTCVALGVGSSRASLMTLRAAKAIAALNGHDAVLEPELSLAAQLVLAWRATAPPQSDAHMDARSDPGKDEPEKSDAGDDTAETPKGDDKALEDVVLAATQAALPADLLARLTAAHALGAKSGLSGRTGALQKPGKRGRRAGTMRGDPRGGARLDLVATLRAAAPWHRIRAQAIVEKQPCSSIRLQIRPSDLRTIRFAERRETLTIFAVDASGSLALNRLAEAKGAVELLLADCYIRRDQVALIAFRGRRADLILPPTRSLLRAKRCLSGLPGGGGTPLASGIDAAGTLAQAALRRGQSPLIVMLTDGRANIARDGSPGRPAAKAEALASAAALYGQRLKSLLIDTAPQPDFRAEELASAMGACYLALPRTDASVISSAVKGAWAGSGMARNG